MLEQKKIHQLVNDMTTIVRVMKKIPGSTREGVESARRDLCEYISMLYNLNEDESRKLQQLYEKQQHRTLRQCASAH